MKGKSPRALRPAKPRLHYLSMFRFSFYREKIVRVSQMNLFPHLIILRAYSYGILVYSCQITITFSSRGQDFHFYPLSLFCKQFHFLVALKRFYNRIG
jgi:hypothetical protein